jgi:pimeloyl-ACP methyl ester carboxylesterase
MIERRTFSIGLAAGVAGALLGTGRAQAVPTVRNVVLIHGLYADGSSWSKCIPLLQAAGLNVTAVQNPLTTFEDDVASAQRALALQDGPTVLVAHSYGGMVLTQAGVAPNVTAVVYIAARAPDANEDYSALAKRFPTPPASAGLITTDGYSRLGKDAFLNDFANGVDPIEANVLYAVQQTSVSSLSGTAKATAAAWREKPSFYAVSKQDRTINPELERFMAARMKATTIEIDSGHLSLVSHPHEVSQLILQAAGQA